VTQANVDPDLGKLDELLALLEQSPESAETRLAQEHIQAARTYLLGAMNDEYLLNLALAREVIQEMPDGDARARMQVLLGAC
jgi:hypothetical protein